MATSIAAAQLQHYLALRKAADSYADFVDLMYPGFTLAPFQLELINALDLLEKRQLFPGPHHSIPAGIDLDSNPPPRSQQGAPVRNLLITMPPRHAKSTWATINFPAYFLGRDPRRFVMSTSYNSILAKDFGRQVRAVMKEPAFKSVFPAAIISRDKTATDAFSTTEHGAYFGIGLDGTTSGRPANLLIVDDPFKSRVDAESQLNRDRVWDFYTSALALRLQPELNGAVPLQLVILTRWHPDDLAGRIMQTDEWHQGLWQHINFPALSPVPDSDPVVYKALWPERFPVAELLRKKALNEREFEALYQQRPAIVGGNLIKTEWFQHYARPLDSYISVIISADTAFKDTKKSDYTVFCVAGLTRNGDIHILDLQRGKWDLPEAKRRLIALNTVWRGRGLRGVYIEDKASGMSLIQELRSHSGLSVIPYRNQNVDKITRAHISLPIIEGGRVFIPDPTSLHPPVWLDEFIRETSQFPSAAHDDIVDAFLIALDSLSRVGISANHIEQLFDIGSSLNSAPLTAGGKSLNALLKAGKAPRPIGW